MNNRIRKITIAQGHYHRQDVMNYVIGGNAYGDYKIVEIVENDKEYTIKIKNSQNELVDWKKFNKNVAVSIEYSLDFDNEIDY